MITEHPPPAGELLDTLQQDLIQLECASRLRLQTARRVGPADVVAAQKALEEGSLLRRDLRARSAFLRDLMEPGTGGVEFVRLSEELETLGRLLSTEARMRGCRILIRTQGGGVWANRARLRRRLFALVLRELIVASANGSTTLCFELQHPGPMGD